MKILILLILLGFQSIAFSAEKIQSEHIRVSFVLPESFSAGKQVIGIRYAPEEHWHVYWKNPGDSGAAPKFDFQKLEGVQDPKVLWPRPHRLPIGSLTNLGYPDEVILPIELKIEGQTARVQVKLEWLVCNEGECVPGFGTLDFSRPIGEEKWTPENQKQLSKFLSQVPKPDSEAPFKIEKVEKQEDGVIVQISDPDVEIFPTNPEHLLPGKPVNQKLKFQVGQNSINETGFVMAKGDQAWEWEVVRFESASDSYLLLLLFAFLGGVILNFMPCVLPVLSIKLMSLVQTNDGKTRVREALLYSVGVLSAFLALGSGFLILRSFGSAIGWGFHLQSPAVIFALILLFWVMGLYFLGVIQWGDALMNWAGNHSSKSSFMVGLLSVFVAAPCTGPFMGSALGAAATLPVLPALLLFVFLGLGLAFPFLALTLSPKAMRHLPKPGLWMEKLKQFLAFPLFGTVVWLTWVLQKQTGESSWLAVVAILLTISFCVWLANFKNKIWKIISALLVIASAGYGFQNLKSQKVTIAPNAVWKEFSPDAVQRARESQDVFIDFTAAWCITCQVNKKAVLETEAGQNFFNEHNVALFTADWTNQDPVVTKALEDLGRSSVPVYVFYRKGSDKAVILPQILTLSDFEKLYQ